MGGPNKLMATLDGEPLVRHAVRAALEGGLSEVVVVTGHQGERVASALAGLNVRLVTNPRYAEGLSTSLKAGLAALGEEVDGALVLLGDMPRVGAGLVRRLAEAFDPASGRHIVVPVAGGRRGNPVLWGRRFFGELMKVTGDQGGRTVLASSPEAVIEVPVEGDAVHLDLDTPEALAAAGGATAG
jgi:molybdenum cofactor cytidylyltransferase